jgi:HAD superfamily hydrolase (TIGR01450 family)
LDGTIYLGDHLIEGALELLGWLQEVGVPYVFFTNNSGKTRAQIVAKLRGMGLDADESNTYTSGRSTADYAVRRGWRHVACIGTDALCEMLTGSGVDCVGAPSEAEALIVGLVPRFEESALPDWLTAVPAGAPIVAANVDIDYPVEGGKRLPGAGAVLAAVEHRVGRRCKFVVGKPGTFMLDMLCEDHGFDSHRVLVVGDSTDSDIAMAEAAGAPSVLIDTGGHASRYTGAVSVPDLHGLLKLLKAPGGLER